MSQLLVRDLEKTLVAKLKRRAAAQGISTEELHRRILREALSRPALGKPSLIEFLISPEDEVAPGVELDLRRAREFEARDLDLG